MIKHAVLNESGEVIPATLLEWAWWSEANRAHRVIELTMLPGDIKVSTVFLDVNHEFFSHQAPLWFETMVFGPPETTWNEIIHEEETIRLGYCERYTTLAQAKVGHQLAINWAKKNLVNE